VLDVLAELLCGEALVGIFAVFVNEMAAMNGVLRQSFRNVRGAAVIYSSSGGLKR
jgi:hypothetical protein